MSDAILLLRIEHHQTSDILSIIEDQLKLDGELDLELIRSIVEYFGEYPDQCHHPVEDLVFRFVKKRDPDRSADIAEVLREHKGIAGLTQELRTELNSVVSGNAVNDDELRTTLKGFVDSYRAHMQAEEDCFFPLALETLQRADWAEIEYALFESSDPLYDKEEEDRFRALCREIEERATASFRRGALVRETRKLGKLTGVEDFNDSMSKMHSAYRLVEHPEGSFGLEHGGQTVIDIPKCSPARAAWCAYYHVVALAEGESPGQSGRYVW